jgi:hypothetical protein
MRGVPAPFPKVFGGALGRVLLAVNLALIRVSKTVFAYQIFVEAESTPDIDFLLKDALEKSGAPRLPGGADEPMPLSAAAR